MIQRHLWFVQPDFDHPCKLGRFLLASCGVGFSARDQWKPVMLVASVCSSFDSLVVAASDTPAQIQTLCDLIASNPQRLRGATNRLLIITTVPPTLPQGTLEAAHIRLEFAPEALSQAA